jgi:hypothetical protein
MGRLRCDVRISYRSLQQTGRISVAVTVITSSNAEEVRVKIKQENEMIILQLNQTFGVLAIILHISDLKRCHTVICFNGCLADLKYAPFHRYYRSNIGHGNNVKRLYRHVRSEVFTAVTIKNAVFWDVAPCKYFVNRRFGGTYAPS